MKKNQERCTDENAKEKKHFIYIYINYKSTTNFGNEKLVAKKNDFFFFLLTSQAKTQILWLLVWYVIEQILPLRIILRISSHSITCESTKFFLLLLLYTIPITIVMKTF